jgi:hypothetical protein
VRLFGFGALHERGTDSDVMDRIASRPAANRHLKFSHAARAHEAPQPTRMSNIAQSPTRNGAPIDAKQQQAKPSRLNSFSLSSLSFHCSAASAAALPREFLISLGLVEIAVPSIANESATGVLVLAR